MALATPWPCRSRPRGARFREAFASICRIVEPRPAYANAYARPGGGIDLLPTPAVARLPMLIPGSSPQAPEWIAAQGDGWTTYPCAAPALALVAAMERILAGWL